MSASRGNGAVHSGGDLGAFAPLEFSVAAGRCPPPSMAASAPGEISTREFRTRVAGAALCLVTICRGLTGAAVVSSGRERICGCYASISRTALREQRQKSPVEPRKGRQCTFQGAKWGQMAACLWQDFTVTDRLAKGGTAAPSSISRRVIILPISQ